MSDEKCKELIQYARVYLISGRAYLGAALWRMIPIKEPACGTMAVDKYWRLYYNPEFLEKLSVQECAAVLYHEVLHLIRDHSGRAQAVNADPTKWNIAADLEINDNIQEEAKSSHPLTLPQGAIFPSMFQVADGLICEKYYELLKDKIQVVEVPVSAAAAGNCGSGADGRRREWEKGEPSEVDVPGVGKTEADLIRRQVAEDIANNRSIGTVPGHMRRWAEEFLRPKVDWRKELQAVIKHTSAVANGAADYTYTRPSRRASVFPNIVLPRLIGKKPVVAVALDTSGSMKDKEIRTSVELALQLMKQAAAPGSKAVVLDAAVHRVIPIERISPSDLIGGGGTDMRLAFEQVSRMKPKPDLLLVFTDGYTPWPSSPIGVPAVAVLVGSEVDSEGVPTWMKKIRVE
jgi:predicted metal-dependent peptidase